MKGVLIFIFGAFAGKLKDNLPNLHYKNMLQDFKYI